jgi:CBS domain-containing protein
MKVGDLATAGVVTADSSLTVAKAAKLMRDHHVGDLILLEETGSGAKPVGIVTDRDLVVGVMGLGLDPAVFTLEDIQQSPVHTAAADEDADVVMERMRVLGIRRVPIVDALGNLSGIFTLDDYLRYLGQQLRLVNDLVQNERMREEDSRVAIS